MKSDSRAVFDRLVSEKPVELFGLKHKEVQTQLATLQWALCKTTLVEDY